jgi:hypothetical protein
VAYCRGKMRLAHTRRAELNFVPVSGHWGTLALSMKGAPNGPTSTELYGRV